MFTSFLFEKLSHLSSVYNTEAEFIQHLMSGEVKMEIPDIIRLQQEYEKTKPPLPCQHQHGDKVWLNLWSANISAEILNVHFYDGKVKYDLELFGGNGETTRIYNVDSVFVVKTLPAKG